jgi:hypothetical protein
MSPSEWCFGVISDVASGIITRKWRAGFKWREGDAGHFLESGVQMEKGKCCGIFWRTGFKWRKGDTGCFLENGVHNDDRELSSGDWG